MVNQKKIIIIIIFLKVRPSLHKKKNKQDGGGNKLEFMMLPTHSAIYDQRLNTFTVRGLVTAVDGNTLIMIKKKRF